MAEPKPIKKRRITGRRVLLALLILLLLPGAWLGFKFIYNASKVFHGNVLSVLNTTKLKGEDSGRVNILLAGNSSDDPLHQGADLTDSIMIISIDTKNNNAYMLSIPRDLWVEIPGYGHAKINEAYVDGEDGKFNSSGYFPGGMGLLQKVIQQKFDVNLNYYGLVDYNAFRDMVNAVGGIDFNVQSTDKRGLYDPSIDYTTHGPLVRLTNGVHTLNGQQALDLARARGDAYGSYGFPQSDFDRTAHQRQELLALRSKASSTGVLANPVKLSSLLDAVGNNVKTNFSLSEVHRLYDITKTIPGSSIQSLSLNDAKGKNLLTSYTTSSGQAALAPEAGLDDFSDIQAFIHQVTSSNPVTREGASVVILNATETSGMAAKAKQTLTAKGVHVAAVGDATTDQAVTSIIDVSGGKDPATLQLLKQQYGASVSTTNSYANVYDADFIVLIGADQIPKTTTPTTTQ
jgi:LCP family protein required for cell wall assembly